MPDTNFIAAFADHPLTLGILMIAVVIVVYIWKVGPVFKAMSEKADSSAGKLDSKMDQLITSDAHQTTVINTLEEHVRLNTLDVLRMTVYDGKIDPEDRLVAARRYFLRGGNGRVAAYTKTLIEQFPAAWKTILAMSKDEERSKLEEVLSDQS